MKNKLLKSIINLEKNNRERLHLTAYENQMSKTAARFLSLKLSERYYFGGGEKGIKDLNPFLLIGLKEVEQLVSVAEKALKKMLGAKIVNLNCLSGLHAMMCALVSVTKPGDLILSVDRQDGGHFATARLIKRIGRRHDYLPYNLQKMEFNIKKLKQIVRKNKPKAIYLNVSYYIKPHNLRAIRGTIGKNVLIIYDASHVLGLIMGGQFQDPFREGADVICANTHKTLPGPQKGLIAFKSRQLGERANQIISYLYSSTHTHHLIALAVTILEMEKFASSYARQIIRNSQALGNALTKLGHQVRMVDNKNYSLNHQIHMFISKADNKKIFNSLLSNNISINIDRLLGRKMFIRFGTQEITRLGMKEREMEEIAKLIDEAINNYDVKKRVITLVRKFRKIKFSFD